MKPPGQPACAALLGIALLILSPASAFAALNHDGCSAPTRGPCGGRPLDEMWLIRSRTHHCDSDSTPQLSVYRYERAATGGVRRWESSDLTTFLDADGAQRSTLFYVHGNHVDSAMVWSRALTVYRSLVRDAGEAPPIRFVMWAWPAERMRGPIQDVRVKARRTGPAGYHLAWLVDRLDPKTPVGLVGFSFGARVITGSLHLLGGGRMGPYTLRSRQHPQRPALRVVLLTAALDDDWLLPGHYHGRALSQVDRMLVMINPTDRAMRWYRLIDRYRRPEALGRYGVASLCSLGAQRKKLEQRNVACRLGPVHDIAGYLSSPVLMRQTFQFASFSAPASDR